MGWWILLGSAAACVAVAWCLRGIVGPQSRDGIAVFVEDLVAAIHDCGPEYVVRTRLPESGAIVVAVHGQEVPVPLDNLYRHFVQDPKGLPSLARQLLEEIEEVGLERPTDHPFAEVAMRILPQIRSREWLLERAPAFGDAALVHRDLGPDLVLCYVIDDPWSMVFACQAHLKFWGRSEEDVFHLANQNLRRMSLEDVPMPSRTGGPVRIQSGDGYDAARVLLLDPDHVDGLLIAMPSGDSLFLGQQDDRDQMISMLMREDAPRAPLVSDLLYRLQGQELVPLTGLDRE